MREKSMKLLVTFHTTAGAMAMVCTAPKKKNSSLGIAVSVFIDIVSFDR